MQQMQEWLQGGGLNLEAHAENAHEMANALMVTLRKRTDEFFPTKSRKVTNDNQTFFSDKLATIKRKNQREYNKNRKSIKWKRMDIEYNLKLSSAKKNCII